MQALDLIATARILLRAGNGKPTQANLRRAHSSAYYALFHCIARQSADTLMGGTGAIRSRGAWRQTYRALEHIRAKEACKHKKFIALFPDPIQDFANSFATMQEKRHAADYDPSIRLSKSEVLADVDVAENNIKNFATQSIKHRRAFCAYLLFKMRNS